MAKRRRLIPPKQPVDWSTRVAKPDPATRPLNSPPIASVAGEASAAAALAEVSGVLNAARDEGRLIQRVPLERVDETHLVRDRLAVDDDAMESLVESLRARGQQTPVEVVELGTGHYGLISGWRRLTALRRLLAETGDARFAAALAILRQPENASASYVAMVEENEVRVGLSYYERARIVVRSVEEGVYPDQKLALQGLFASASRAKRSKIKSFIPIVEALDGVLQYPTEIGERLGLQLGRRLVENPGMADRMRTALAKDPPPDAQSEQAVLARPDAASSPSSAPDPVPANELVPGIRMDTRKDRITLAGPGIDAAFRRDLVAWMAARKRP